MSRLCHAIASPISSHIRTKLYLYLENPNDIKKTSFDKKRHFAITNKSTFKITFFSFVFWLTFQTVPENVISNHHCRMFAKTVIWLYFHVRSNGWNQKLRDLSFQIPFKFNLKEKYNFKVKFKLNTNSKSKFELCSKSKSSLAWFVLTHDVASIPASQLWHCHARFGACRPQNMVWQG